MKTSPASATQSLVALGMGIGGNGHDVNPLAAFIEIDFAIDQGEQGPIPASADITAGDEFSAALAHDNAAGPDEFTAKSLNAQTLTDTVAPVANATLTFFMCHNSFLRFDFCYFNPG